MDNRRPDVGGQAEAAAELVPDEFVDFPFEEVPDDDDPSPEVELDFFSVDVAELDDESPEPDAAADFEGSAFVDESESDDDSLPAALRLSLR